MSQQLDVHATGRARPDVSDVLDVDFDVAVDSAYVYSQILTDLKSNDKTDKLHGVALVSKLVGHSSGVGAAGSHLDIALERLGEALQFGLPPHSMHTSVMVATADAVGQVARALLDGMRSNFFRLEATRALEWLCTGRDAFRHAAVLLMRALASHDGDKFQECVLDGPGGEAFLGHLFAAVSDAKATIREASVAALREVLRSTLTRDLQARDTTFSQVYRHISNGLTTRGSTDAVHGALHALREALALRVVVRNRRLLVDVYRQALRYLEKGPAQLQRSAVALVPVLSEAIPPRLFALTFEGRTNTTNASSGGGGSASRSAGGGHL